MKHFVISPAVKSEDGSYRVDGEVIVKQRKTREFFEMLSDGQFPARGRSVQVDNRRRDLELFYLGDVNPRRDDVRCVTEYRLRCLNLCLSRSSGNEVLGISEIYRSSRNTLSCFGVPRSGIYRRAAT